MHVNVQTIIIIYFYQQVYILQVSFHCQVDSKVHMDLHS